MAPIFLFPAGVLWEGEESPVLFYLEREIVGGRHHGGGWGRGCWGGHLHLEFKIACFQILV